MAKADRPERSENIINAIEKRQAKSKELIIEQLKKTPIVQIACEKAGVGRATYYRWRQEDKDFIKSADEALLEGSLLVNDVAESRLISAIHDQNLGAIIFWLKHHHPNYTTKVEVTAKLKQDDERLTADQKSLLDKALMLTGLGNTTSKEGGN
ncbi:MAG: hypothetical protein A2Y57_02275 [Candidatus Woykebacteria bacterium RBG_13_40_7b]|uniref:Uncharacterized protein n=1 Tax=Candidatus Woykebacteria bacterium RBG_13_40_7b TaxID=1802594 RepID=A0A1G1W8P6_9BACT|nr:MAG: hypothetical protein A2Y57_02275 [Candidatus Woykebacteria bacterium RBG_13_40_7b]